MSRKQVAIADLLVAMVLIAAVAASSIALLDIADGSIPRRNVYFNADTDRVFANLIDRNSNYARLSVHPLFGIVCIVFQNIFKITNDLKVVLQLWSGIQGALFALFLYLNIRLWGGNIRSAAAGTLLGAGSGGFLYWAPITETHFLGGITVLALTALWRWQTNRTDLAIARSMTMFALGASITITDAVASGLAQLRMEFAFQRRLKAFVTDNLGQFGLVALGGLAGLGLLTLCSALQNNVLHNQSIPPLLGLAWEAKYVSAERGSLIDLLNVIGLVDGTRGLLWLVNLAGAVAVLWALVANGRERAFIALWPLFGFILHSLYDRAHSFLFAPNYLPSAIVSISLAVGSRWPRFGYVSLGMAAATLALLNQQGYCEKRKEIATQSDPPGWYLSLRIPHAVPNSDVVRPADPPIGFDQ